MFSEKKEVVAIAWSLRNDMGFSPYVVLGVRSIKRL